MKKAVIVSSVLLIGITTGIAVLNGPQPTKAVDSPLTTQVDQQSKELANHEARITNTENNVKDLQTNTNTTPSTNQVAVPDATPTPTPTAPVVEPTQVTVVSYKQIPVDNGTDCEFTYSDGTTYTWHWQTVNPHGSWQTSGDGSNGHWVSTTSTSGDCDSTSIGNH
jgi:hypothetical protein